MPIPAIPTSFAAKKSQILLDLAAPGEAYTDNSPKGTVDVQIRELIDEINAYEGFVTTSSCAGRVAVFVEGPRKSFNAAKEERHAGAGQDEDGDGDGDQAVSGGEGVDKGEGGMEKAKATTSPGGKGGGRWLYVSHDPISVHSSTTNTTNGAAPKSQEGYYSTLLNLTSQDLSTAALPSSTSTPHRLVHLSFSPLILHIHCATLHHARPLLAAAINAGFRESGVQSLRISDPAEAEKGVMVAVRTAGLAFDTVVGVVVEEANREEVVQRIVSEEYLTMCVGVVNERFKWNDGRRERFREELRRAMEREGLASGTAAETRGEWEDKDERRRRKRQEGLARQRINKGNIAENDNTGQQDEVDGLDGDLSTLGIG